jgi:hypothetical protein
MELLLRKGSHTEVKSILSEFIVFAELQNIILSSQSAMVLRSHSLNLRTQMHEQQDCVYSFLRKIDSECQQLNVLDGRIPWGANVPLGSRERD